MRKVTITLPEELVAYADRRAAELGTNRSQVIGQAMATLILSEEEALAVEGYRFYAAEAEAFATVGGVAAAEAIIANTEWAIAE
ncbi:MAG: hypothetical protein KIT52_08440 [Anaerolineae bacterium]|nr:hypothetical protein [Anaerolineae bacterium]